MTAERTRNATLKDLAELIAGREMASKRSPSAIAVGWDESLTLARNAVHEWFALESDTLDSRDEAARGHRAAQTRCGWAPPLLPLIHLAHQAMRSPQQLVLWIGRRVRPYPQVLVRRESAVGSSESSPSDPSDRGLLERSLFVDVRNTAERVWAIDLALRCPAVAVVIADGSGLDMAQTRRLQLAAESGGVPGPPTTMQGDWGPLALLARPPWELNRRSAASTRWVVRPAATPASRASPRMRIDLVRCKGLQRVLAPDADLHRSWMLDWDCHAQSLIGVSADVADRPDQENAVRRAG